MDTTVDKKPKFMEDRKYTVPQRERCYKSRTLKTSHLLKSCDEVHILKVLMIDVM